MLKSTGYHLEHNFGHGKHKLAMMFAAMNRRAFAIHAVCDCLKQFWIDARAAGHETLLRAYQNNHRLPHLPDGQTLMQTLIDSKPPPTIAAQIVM